MMQIFFNFTLALRAVRTNRLRSALTITIIGLGIMALVSILTAIEVMKQSISTNFSSMGANSFQITSDIIKKKRGGGPHISITEGKAISYEQARLFKERFTFPSTVGISATCSGIATVHYGSEKTNPNVSVVGVDEAYMTVTDTKIQEGRNFSYGEIYSTGATCVLGSAVATRLFKKKIANAVNQVISIGSVKCRVVGVMEEKGGSMMRDADNTVLLPLNLARSLYGSQTYLISVIIPQVGMKDFAAEEAEGIFRVIRNLPIGTENNFTVTQNNEIVTIMLDSIRYVRWAAVIIGVITLLGSVIGLMNIMLVSVAERTREIGVSKALGARSSTIKSQFLTESIIISMLGGITGIISGILMGNIVSFFFGSGFVVPWVWIGLGVSLCAIVGVVSGIYPAIKASRLDPIVALRYE